MVLWEFQNYITKILFALLFCPTPVYAYKYCLITLYTECFKQISEKNLRVLLCPKYVASVYKTSRLIGLEGRVFANGPETSVQSQVRSYQRLLKWHLILLCLTLSIIRYVSWVKWSNLGEGVAPFPTTRCSSYWKGSLQVALDNGHQLYLLSDNCISVILSLLYILWDDWPISNEQLQQQLEYTLLKPDCHS